MKSAFESGHNIMDGPKIWIHWLSFHVSLKNYLFPSTWIPTYNLISKVLLKGFKIASQTFMKPLNL